MNRPKQPMGWDPSTASGSSGTRLSLALGTLVGLLIYFCPFVPLFSAPAFAATADEAAPTTIIRTSLDSTEPIVVGQLVRLNVDLLVETWFKQAPQVPELRVNNAISIQPPNSSVNFTERIKGQTYAGQRRTYFIFPQKPGRYDLPPLTFILFPAQPGQTPQPVTVTSQPLQFMAFLPPSLQDKQLDYAISTAKLTVENNFDQDLQTLHVGDAVTQSLTLTAADILGGALPSIELAELSGLTAYPNPPKVVNRYNRGSLIGERTESITYVIERPGHYHLPDNPIFWWDTQTQSLQSDIVPGAALSIHPTPQQRLQQLMLGAGVLTALALILVYSRRRLLTWVSAYQQHQKNTENAYFKELHQACQSDDPQDIYNTLLAWLAHPDINIHSLTTLITQINQPELSQQISLLEARLYAVPSSNNSAEALTVSSHSLYQQLAKARKRLKKKTNDPSYQPNARFNLNP